MGRRHSYRTKVHSVVMQILRYKKTFQKKIKNVKIKRDKNKKNVFKR